MVGDQSQTPDRPTEMVCNVGVDGGWGFNLIIRDIHFFHHSEERSETPVACLYALFPPFRWNRIGMLRRSPGANFVCVYTSFSA